MKLEIIQKLFKLASVNNIFRHKALRNIFIVSVLLAAVLPAYMILFIYPAFTNLLVESTKESALRAATHLKSELFIQNIRLGKTVVNTEFLRTVGTVKNDLDLKKLKIFSESGEIIFSTDQEDIGNINKESYFHDIVAKGNVFAQMVQKNTETLEGQILTSDVVETYVPVMNEDSFHGAFEIYYDITSRKQALDKLLSHSTIILVALSFGLLFVVFTVLIKENKAILGRKRAEEALQIAHHDLKAKATELEEVNSELSQYTRVVSHDLQAPLRAISNYANFLREDLEPTLKGEQKEYLDALGRTVQEAAEMIKDLLEVSRVGRKGAALENVNTGTFLRDLIDTLHLPDNVKIMMPDDWPTIEADPVLLRQIFQNLIENAVKFNDSSEICVELGWRKHADEHCKFLVRDNGIGIEEHYHEQIFRMLKRLHTRKEYQGTGVGLAIVKKAVTKLGGSIRIESKSGEGSTFIVTLPKAQATR